MRSIARALVVIAAVLSASPVWPQGGGKPDPPRTPGPTAPSAPQGSPQFRARISGEVAVGEAAPDFELDGSRGRPVKLSSYRKQWLVLLFGDRKEDVSVLREHWADLDSSGINILGVCAEKTYFLVPYAKREAFPYVMVTDMTREISGMYGLYDYTERKILPGFLLIDPRGDIRMALLGQSIPPSDVARIAKYVAGMP